MRSLRCAIMMVLFNALLGMLNNLQLLQLLVAVFAGNSTLNGNRSVCSTSATSALHWPQEKEGGASLVNHDGRRVLH
ncbi:uncharacterized protein PHALS_15121 [Plasmopara halstedii]|uniref:RxLR-like protein n=1 Tax=Plasmopara halstedii TaxID=4781 RepID=A0A0P1ABS2_PLAHL|nr:uncharacterized protein PHALS_15121 [Plasmopara halstedii]CEG37855.1 hypothetical protein PHALS_15121 [Plasmopara halstedii]|eukprot:XP_024574224.1 hypothetical protein PHALS_15121 [Plasmopara halstedii]